MRCRTYDASRLIAVNDSYVRAGRTGRIFAHPYTLVHAHRNDPQMLIKVSEMAMILYSGCAVVFSVQILSPLFSYSPCLIYRPSNLVWYLPTFFRYLPTYFLFSDHKLLLLSNLESALISAQSSGAPQQQQQAIAVARIADRSASQ